VRERVCVCASVRGSERDNGCPLVGRLAVSSAQHSPADGTIRGLYYKSFTIVRYASVCSIPYDCKL